MAAELTMKEQIMEAIDDIRPYLQSHNGDLEFVSYEDGVVNVKLQGACDGATMTLKNGIQRILQEEFGEENVKSVEAV